jgi:glycosyltransferase involved in cell wall biosynthesis
MLGNLNFRMHRQPLNPSTLRQSPRLIDLGPKMKDSTVSSHRPVPMPSVYFLEDRIPWFGKFNGYEPLTRYLPSTLPHRVFAPAPGLVPRLLGKLHSLRHGVGPAPQAKVDAFRRFFSALAKDRDAVGHVLYGEHFLPYLKCLAAHRISRSAFTFHQPFGQWAETDRLQLNRVDHAIFLFTPPAGTFEAHLRRAPTVIPLGVDTDFFSPLNPPSQRRVLYSGVHLRNLKMLERVIDRLLSHDPKVVVDMLVPESRRNEDVFQRLTRSDRVFWHAGLGEIELRDLYRRSDLMLLPMQDSGANTAVVEALACGLPIVTTDVGGIRDYGGGTVFPVVRNDDDQAAFEMAVRLLDDAPYRASLALAGRAFAIDILGWQQVIPRHLAVYQGMALSL